MSFFLQTICFQQSWHITSTKLRVILVPFLCNFPRVSWKSPWSGEFDSELTINTIDLSASPQTKQDASEYDHIFTSWWFQTQFLNFHPYLGKWSNLTNIFQMGWNHLVVIKLKDGMMLWSCGRPHSRAPHSRDRSVQVHEPIIQPSFFFPWNLT